MPGEGTDIMVLALPPTHLTCLEFASRSESFAFEPAVQLSSISSLTGLTACRPSANSLPQAGEGGLNKFSMTEINEMDLTA